MTIHPLSSSQAYGTANLANIIEQAVQTPSSIPFAIVGILAGQILFYATSTAFAEHCPSAITDYLADDRNLTLQRIGWLAPVIGIPLASLAGRAAFELMPNVF